MKLKLMTPEKIVLEMNAESVTLPGAVGQFTALDGHDILVAEIKGGRMYLRYKDADLKMQRMDLDIGPGCAEILKHSAHVYVSSAVKV